MLELLKQFNEIGLWDMLSTFILLLGSIAGFLIFIRHKRRIRDLNFYVTWRRDTKERFPLVLHFEIRNLSQSIIVLNSPFLKFDSFKPGPYAHCDSISGEYEIKFRRIETQEESEVACLLRHRETVTSYIPLDENQTDEELMKLSNQGKVGTLYCDVIVLERKPRVIRLKLKLSGVVLNKAADYPRRQTDEISEQKEPPRVL